MVIKKSRCFKSIGFKRVAILTGSIVQDSLRHETGIAPASTYSVESRMTVNTLCLTLRRKKVALALSY